MPDQFPDAGKKVPPRPLDGSPLTIGATLAPGDTANLEGVQVTLIWCNPKMARIRMQTIPKRTDEILKAVEAQ